MLGFLSVLPLTGFYIRGMVHKKVMILFVIIGIASAVLAAALWLQFGASSSSQLRGAQLRIGEREYAIEIAESAAAQVRGLSGREGLPANSGMLFMFQKPEPRLFWMYQMKFPIDIIWIREGVVVGVAENAPAPQGVSLPASFRSPEPADMVLEVAAGTAQRDGIRVGAEVVLSR